MPGQRVRTFFSDEDGAATSEEDYLPFGHWGLVYEATTPGSLTFQFKVPGADTWIDIETITATGLTEQRLPAGLYRATLNGTAVGAYFSLHPIQ